MPSYIQAIVKTLHNVKQTYKFFLDKRVSANSAQQALYSAANWSKFDRLLNLMTFNASDVNITSNTNWTSGVNRYRNITIGSSVTLNLNTGPGVIIADTITNNGLINSNWIKANGGGSPGSGGWGGKGIGGIIILARNMKWGTIRANGLPGAVGGQGTADGGGGAGQPGLFWLIYGDVVPQGRAGGGTSKYGGGAAGTNGGGGGAAQCTYGGPGGAGGNAQVQYFYPFELIAELMKCACDYWLMNVVGKTPSSYKSFPMLGGSGGGGGGGANDYPFCCTNGGGGGGGAGQIIAYSTYIEAGSIITNEGIGSAGGNPCSGYGSAAWGGSGGGGVAYIYCRNYTGTWSMSTGLNGYGRVFVF